VRVRLLGARHAGVMLCPGCLYQSHPSCPNPSVYQGCYCSCLRQASRKAMVFLSPLGLGASLCFRLGVWGFLPGLSYQGLGTRAHGCRGRVVVLCVSCVLCALVRLGAIVIHTLDGLDTEGR
jgi:hypothetical protein